ncbi:MAG TPA: thioesterase domain-containing protein [Tahibacter sp.]|nr:thioesterase domain-containing protein [Tahibacter sp.]HSX59262.1 thioesterase domain-containing protein [Tahibacter sp.]
MPASDSSGLLRRGAADPGLRLFCFPYAGGGANQFLDWQPAREPFIEACGIQLPGHGRRLAETAWRDRDALVAACVAAIAAEPALPLFGPRSRRAARVRDRAAPAGRGVGPARAIVRLGLRGAARASGDAAAQQARRRRADRGAQAFRRNAAGRAGPSRTHAARVADAAPRRRSGTCAT